MKILVITEQSDRPESALLCGLATKGHIVKILGKLHPEFENEATKLNIECQDFKVRSKLDFTASSTLKKIIQEFDPDVVYAFSGRGLSAAIRCKNSKSRFKLVTYRGTVGHLSRLDPSSWISYLNPKIDAISCVSNAVKNYLIRQSVPESKLFTVYKGHRASWYDLDKSVSRKDLGIEDGHYIVSCVANDRPVKGLDIFIDAANMLSENIHFLIIGGIRNQKLVERAKNKNVRFLGFRKDAQAIIGLSDLLVVPSRGREGLPKSLLEAMSQKKAIIASRVGGIPEAVSHEKEAILIPAEDPYILAQAIEYLRSNPEISTRLALGGFNKLVNELTVEKMVDSSAQLLRCSTI